jgi:hypothetical protein
MGTPWVHSKNDLGNDRAGRSIGLQSPARLAKAHDPIVPVVDVGGPG